MSSPPTSARLRALRALMRARASGIGLGWLSLGGVARGMQAIPRMALIGVNEGLNLGHVEIRTVMGQDHFRITPAGAGYLLGLEQAKRA